MFSIFKCRMHSGSLRRFFEAKFDQGFRDWYHLMNQRCQPLRGGFMGEFQR